MYNVNHNKKKKKKKTGVSFCEISLKARPSKVERDVLVVGRLGVYLLTALALMRPLVYTAVRTLYN